MVKAILTYNCGCKIIQDEFGVLINYCMKKDGSCKEKTYKVNENNTIEKV